MQDEFESIRYNFLYKVVFNKSVEQQVLVSSEVFFFKGGGGADTRVLSFIKRITKLIQQSLK